MKLFVVSAYIGDDPPDHFTMIGDEGTSLKKYLELLDDMEAGVKFCRSSTFIVILAEIVNYPVSLNYTSGIEISNTKTIRLAYDVEDHRLVHYGIPDEIENDFEKILQDLRK